MQQANGRAASAWIYVILVGAALSAGLFFVAATTAGRVSASTGANAATTVLGNPSWWLPLEKAAIQRTIFLQWTPEN